MALNSSVVWAIEAQSSYLSQPPQPTVVYFFWAGVLFSIENTKIWPFLAYFDYFYMLLHFYRLFCRELTNMRYVRHPEIFKDTIFPDFLFPLPYSQRLCWTKQNNQCRVSCHRIVWSKKLILCNPAQKVKLFRHIKSPELLKMEEEEMKIDFDHDLDIQRWGQQK